MESSMQQLRKWQNFKSAIHSCALRHLLHSLSRNVLGRLHHLCHVDFDSLASCGNKCKTAPLQQDLNFGHSFGIYPASATERNSRMMTDDQGS